MSKGNTFTRRNFIKTTGIAAGAILVGGGVLATGALTSKDVNAQATRKQMDHKAPESFKGKMFFTNDTDFKTLQHATERIFPKDKNGPGAIELGAPYFIDNQLAGAYGYNAREYTKGPHINGVAGQGYQTPLSRREIFLLGLAALNKEANEKYKTNFADIKPAEQDAILKDCEKGDLKMPSISSSYFFSLLKSATLAGVYADPIYNGNNNMDGWKMKKYPGAQMTYLDIIESKKFQKIAPVSLASMQ